MLKSAFRVSSFLLVFLLFLQILHGQGSPPLRTDDPGTPGDGVWEVQLGFATEKSSRDVLYSVPLLDVGYGLGEEFEISYTIPWSIFDEEDEDAINGPGNSILGFKWRFLDQEDGIVDMAMNPELEFNTLTKSADRGLVDEGTSIFLPVEIQKNFGSFFVNPEIGLVLNERDHGEWKYGLALGHEISKRFDLFGEVHGVADNRLGDHNMVFNLGGQFVFNEFMNLQFSAGRGFRGSAHGEPEFISYLGLKFIF